MIDTLNLWWCPPEKIRWCEGGVVTSTDGTAAAVPDPGVGFLLARAGGRAIRTFNRALQPFGLRSRHYMVLLITAGSGGSSQRDLGEALGIDPSAVVALVDDLERVGLVRRVTHHADRRTRLVTATADGAALLDRLRALSAAADDDLVSRLDPQERRTLLGLLSRVAFD